jgi:hypothetical protein
VVRYEELAYLLVALIIEVILSTKFARMLAVGRRLLLQT